MVTLLVAMASSGLVACEGEQASSASDVETVTTPLVIVNSHGPGSGHSLDYLQCANEGGTCIASPASYLAYGANGFFVWKVSSASSNATACNSSTFGIDPIPGTAKACYRSNYTQVLQQNQVGTGSGNVEIAYGAFGIFNFLGVSGSYTCSDAEFGDPVPGYAKSCFQANAPYNAVATEGGTITGLNSTPIAYGANGRFDFRVESGSFPCTIGAWIFDPAPGYIKACYKLSGSYVADEPNSFSNSGTHVFKYGSGLNGNFLTKVTSNGVIPCTNANFGGDPDPGHAKHCYVL